MTLSFREENAKTLAALLGLDDEQAAKLLGMSVELRTGPEASAQAFRRHLTAMLARTVAAVHDGGTANAAIELIVGRDAPIASACVVHVGVTETAVVISCEERPEHDPSAKVPEVVLLLAACYAAGMAVRLGLGAVFSLPHHNTIRLPMETLLAGREDMLREPTALGRVYLAGAGAIGNAVVWALATMEVAGELHIVDPKRVSAGNLSRCLWFEPMDVGKPKASALVERSQRALPRLKLVSRVGQLQALEDRNAGPWLERLVVAVDSRRARRSLQEELPREIYDASTTGVEEVVLHFNTAWAIAAEHTSAAERRACLSCVYAEDPVECAHEHHVANLLGVDIADVKRQLIDAGAAQRIVARHPQLDAGAIEGTAYDTLFKTLCATGKLGVESGRTVLAPLSFVSVLAGTYLALELVLRVAGMSRPGGGSPTNDASGRFNSWRVSPWTSPIFELQRRIPAKSNCEACANQAVRVTMRALWGPNGQEVD